MCFAPKPPDNSALVAEQQRQFDIEQQRLAEEEARRQEEAARQREAEELRAAERLAIQQEQERRAAEQAAARQAAIIGANTAIDNVASGYNDDYFTNFANDYLAYYTPALESQYEEARKQAAFDLARRGISDSSAAAGLYGKLTEREAQERARLQQDATSQAQALRQNINNQFSTLRQQAVASGGVGDYEKLAAEAVAGVSPPERQPLGDVFAELLANGMVAGGDSPAARQQQGAAGVPNMVDSGRVVDTMSARNVPSAARRAAQPARLMVY